MSSLDLIVRGGTVVTPEETRMEDIGILGGKIVELRQAQGGRPVRLSTQKVCTFFPG